MKGTFEEEEKKLMDIIAGTIFNFQAKPSEQP